MTLIKNAMSNLLGAALPAVLAVITVPYIVRELGVEYFGLLSLITAIVGYFAVLDINVTAGSTKYISQYYATGDHSRLNQTITFGLAVYAAIGLGGMLLLFFMADLLTRQFVGADSRHYHVGLLSLKVAAAGFFLGQVQAYLQSVPGALLRFDIGGKIEASFGIAVPLGTILVLHSGLGLVEVVVLRVVMSAIQICVLANAIKFMLPNLQLQNPAVQIRRELLSFSAYSFLSRLASLTYAQADKLIVGGRVGMAALTFFVVPASLANRVMALVYRLGQVMFPHASSMAAQGRLAELEKDYYIASGYICFLNCAVCILLGCFSAPVLGLWVGEDFAQKGALVLTLIAAAQAVDSLTNVATFVNDGLGAPKVSGVFAVVRAGLGLGLIFVGVSMRGAEGAAWAHLFASAIVSVLFLAYVHGRTVPFSLVKLSACLLRKVALPLSAPLVVAYLLADYAMGGLLNLLASLFVTGLIIFAAGYMFCITPPHRARMQTLLLRFLRRGRGL